MFRDLPQYELRSDRDIPWMPPLPRHWSIERGKALFRRVQREPNASDGVVTCFRDGVVTLRSRRRTTGFTESLKEIGYQGIRRGDLVIHAMDAFAGAVGVSDSDGKGTPVYSVCVPRGKANPYYFAGVVREMARTSWIHSLAKGVRERSTDFRFDAFAVQQLPVPPVEEQAAIVKYLAHANARIDNAIAAKRRLIALLEEQQRVILNEWMLAAPKGDLVPVKALLRPVRSTVGETHRQKTLLSLTLRGVIPRDLENVKGKFPSDFSTYQDVRPGQFVFCLFDVDETPRTVGLSRVEGMITGAYDVFDVGDPSASEYLELFFTAMDNEKAYRPLYSGLRKVLPHDRFLRTFVPFPDAALRQSIVDEIRASRAETDSVITRVSHEVDLLQEFRTRLVADVVTGQVDVRAVSASLPHLSPQDLASSDAATVDGDHFMSDAEGAPE